jgi:glycosyltransferase involved in cell wall biosynthesis
LVRNVSNIGLAGNINRVFELARGKWVWVLGDDDIPAPNALTTCLSAIARSDPAVILIKFSSENGVNEKVAKITSLGQLADSFQISEFYSNFIFISSSVFLRQAFLEQLEAASSYSYTLVPHLVVMLLNLHLGKSILLLPDSLLTPGGERIGGWDLHSLQIGALAIAELPLPTNTLVRLLKRFARNCCGQRWWLYIPSTFFLHTKRSPTYWRLFWFRVASIQGGIIGVYALFCSLLLPPLAENRAIARMVRYFCAIFGLPPRS